MHICSLALCENGLWDHCSRYTGGVTGHLTGAVSKDLGTTQGVEHREKRLLAITQF